MSSKRVLPTITFIIVATVYIMTMPPELTWAHFGLDGGDLIAASVTLGVPHPPGYPIYLFLGKLMSFLPIGTVAYRFTLLSVLPMAGAAAVLTHIVDERLESRLPIAAVAAGLTFAFARLVWQQAIITEVYGLFLLFFSLTITSYLQKKDPFWIGLFWGLTITSHLTGVFLAPLLLTDWVQRGWNGRLPLGGFIGCSPFLLLPLLPQFGSPIVWGDPTTVQGWFFLVTARIYRDLPFQLPLEQFVPRLRDWGAIWLNQMTLAALPLLGVGIWQRVKNGRGTAWGLGGTAVIYFIYAFTYDTSDAIVFSLPALFLVAILLGDTFETLKWWAVLLPLTLLLLNFKAVNISQDQFVHQQLKNVLESAPENSVIVTAGDPILFAFWYALFVEQERTDLLIVDENLYKFDWYRERLYIQEPSLRHQVPPDMASFRENIRQTRRYCIIRYQDDAAEQIRLACRPVRIDN